MFFLSPSSILCRRQRGQIIVPMAIGAFILVTVMVFFLNVIFLRNVADQNLTNAVNNASLAGVTETSALDYCHLVNANRPYISSGAESVVRQMVLENLLANASYFATPVNFAFVNTSTNSNTQPGVDVEIVNPRNADAENGQICPTDPISGQVSDAYYNGIHIRSDDADPNPISPPVSFITGATYATPTVIVRIRIEVTQASGAPVTVTKTGAAQLGTNN